MGPWADQELNGAKESCSLGDSRIATFKGVRPEQNGRLFGDGIFKFIFLSESAWIVIKISLKFVHKGLNDKKQLLVQVMAWCLKGSKPLSDQGLCWQMASLGHNEFKNSARIFLLNMFGQCNLKTCVYSLE